MSYPFPKKFEFAVFRPGAVPVSCPRIRLGATAQSPPIEIVLARVQEEMVKNEKALQDSTLQMVEKRVTEVMALFEERFNKEVVANAPFMQETVSSAIKEFVQVSRADL